MIINCHMFDFDKVSYVVEHKLKVLLYGPSKTAGQFQSSHYSLFETIIGLENLKLKKNYYVNTITVINK